MTPRLLRFGHAASPVVIVDDCLPDPVQFVAAAVAMAPLPSAEGSYYPGLRRVFAENDQPAWMMTTELLDNVAPYIAGAFDCDGFTLTEASFSLVTLPPDRLIPAQRHPHFDSTDPDVVAAILYLFDAGMDDGTAFYRHAATAIEVVANDNVEGFVAGASQEAAGLSGYFASGMAGYEEIGRVTARYGRLGIWRGNVLHSGLIHANTAFSPDPRLGRLTLNLFLRLTRNPS